MGQLAHHNRRTYCMYCTTESVVKRKITSGEDPGIARPALRSVVQSFIGFPARRLGVGAGATELTATTVD